MKPSFPFHDTSNMHITPSRNPSHFCDYLCYNTRCTFQEHIVILLLHVMYHLQYFLDTLHPQVGRSVHPRLKGLSHALEKGVQLSIFLQNYSPLIDYYSVHIKTTYNECACAYQHESTSCSQVSHTAFCFNSPLQASSFAHFNQCSLSRTGNGAWLSHTKIWYFVNNLYDSPNGKSPISFEDQFAKFNAKRQISHCMICRYFRVCPCNEAVKCRALSLSKN